VFVEVVDADDFNGDTRVVVVVRADDWSLMSFEADALADRYGSRINEMLAGEGWKAHQGHHEWQIPMDGATVQVTLHHGHPDIARVSAVVCSDVAESPDLLRELNALNVANSGVRLFLADEMVRAVVDVRLSEFAGLLPAVREVAQQAVKYGELLNVLTGFLARAQFDDYDDFVEPEPDPKPKKRAPVKVAKATATTKKAATKKAAAKKPPAKKPPTKRTSKD
jgi:hypothetical protein